MLLSNLKSPIRFDTSMGDTMHVSQEIAAKLFEFIQHLDAEAIATVLNTEKRSLFCVISFRDYNGKLQYWENSPKAEIILQVKSYGTQRATVTYNTGINAKFEVGSQQAWDDYLQDYYPRAETTIS